MACEKNCQNQNTSNNSQCSKTGYVTLIVLYILLAIILGSWLWY